MRKFWDSEIAPFMMKLDNGTYALKEIQQRYSFLCQKIFEIFGVRLHIAANAFMPPDFAGEGFCLPTGARFFNGRPEIGMFVPVLASIFEDIRRTKREGARERFETTVISGIIHEMDHFVLGVYGDPQSMSHVIEGETRVWAQTCEHTLRLFYEVHKRELCSNDISYYSNWVRCGRDVENPNWKAFIASLYSRLQVGVGDWTSVIYA